MSTSLGPKKQVSLSLKYHHVDVFSSNRFAEVSRSIAWSPGDLRDKDDFSRACGLEGASIPGSEHITDHQS
jgi:hypothetical protein